MRRISVCAVILLLSGPGVLAADDAESAESHNEPSTQSDSIRGLACVDPLADPYHFEVIYAHPADLPNGYAAKVPTIRLLMNASQRTIAVAGQQTGAHSQLEVPCDESGLLRVENVTLPADAWFGSIRTHLRAQGYDDNRTKYLVYYSDGNACTCFADSESYNDDRAALDNLNNGEGSIVWHGIAFGTTSLDPWMHIVGHALGAVQDSAPHSDGDQHCTDGRDFMCYDDQTNSPIGPETTCVSRAWDCGRDDYFHASAPQGSYLATHWNIGAPYNRYILREAWNFPPTFSRADCSPGSISVGASISCTLNASDHDEVAYSVEWGDGATTRVPTTGYLSSGTLVSTSHTYAAEGNFIVSMYALDNNATGRTSAAWVDSVHVNGPPVMERLDCSPSGPENGTSTTCIVRARDASTSTVRYNLQWGDGSSEWHPVSGTTPQGVNRSISHMWTSVGARTISVYATDNSLSSSTWTTAVQVNANVAPTFTAYSCSPSPAQAGGNVTCTFNASDASAGGISYWLEWGDGAAERVPATGTVPAGFAHSRVHVYAAAGSVAVVVNASDVGFPPRNTTQTIALQVNPPNVPPAITLVSCVDAGATAATPCQFRASDNDSSGVRLQVDWGDGAVSYHPSATTFSTPGSVLSVGHKYALPGNYTISVVASDNGSPSENSSVVNYQLTITPDRTAPALAVQEPRANVIYSGCDTVHQGFGDATFVRRGCVKATASDASGIANVTAYLNGARVAVDTTSPYVLEFPIVTPDPDAELRVVAYDTLGNPRAIVLQVRTI